jgi:hypothetical protein
MSKFGGFFFSDKHIFIMENADFYGTKKQEIEE